MATYSDIATIAARRNDELLTLADAIVRAQEVGHLDLFVKVFNETADKQADNTPTIEEPTMATPTITPADWRKRPASRKQVARTVAMAARKGMHTVKNPRTGEMTPITEAHIATMTAGYVSKLYQALKLRKDVPTMSIESAHVAPIAPTNEWHGYAEGDETSVWIEQMERQFA
jgi:hypothetical protein